MTEKTPDIFGLAYLASEFQAAIERKARANPALATAFEKAVKPTELQEMTRLMGILEKRIPHDQGGNEDAVQAPRAVLLLELVDYYAAISLRVMKEDEVRALAPKAGQTQTVSDLFADNHAVNLAKVFRPKGP